MKSMRMVKNMKMKNIHEEEEHGDEEEEHEEEEEEEGEKAGRKFFDSEATTDY